jgi:hypothetical protein
MGRRLCGDVGDLTRSGIEKRRPRAAANVTATDITVHASCLPHDHRAWRSWNGRTERQANPTDEANPKDEANAEEEAKAEEMTTRTSDPSSSQRGEWQ